MKMIIAIVQDQDSQELADQLVKNNFRATKLATTGGFLRAGNTTFLCGVNDDRVDEILSVINQTCGNREQFCFTYYTYGRQCGFVHSISS